MRSTESRESRRSSRQLWVDKRNKKTKNLVVVDGYLDAHRNRGIGRVDVAGYGEEEDGEPDDDDEDEEAEGSLAVLDALRARPSALRYVPLQVPQTGLTID